MNNIKKLIIRFPNIKLKGNKYIKICNDRNSEFCIILISNTFNINFLVESL